MIAIAAVTMLRKVMRMMLARLPRRQPPER
jgi:hypothetical protein